MLATTSETSPYSQEAPDASDHMPIHSETAGQSSGGSPQGTSPLEITTEVLSRYQKHLSTSGRLNATVESYTKDATYFLHWLLKYHGRRVVYGPEDITHYIDWLDVDRRCTVNSIRRKIIALKNFFRYITATFATGSLTSPAQGIIIPPRDETLPDLLSTEDIERILSRSLEAPLEYKAIRDPVIIALFAFEGLKSYEIRELKRGDILCLPQALPTPLVSAPQPHISSTQHPLLDGPRGNGLGGDRDDDLSGLRHELYDQENHRVMDTQKEEELSARTKPSPNLTTTMVLGGSRSRTITLSHQTSVYLDTYLSQVFCSAAGSISNHPQKEKRHSRERANDYSPLTITRPFSPLFYGLQGRSGRLSDRAISRHGLKAMLYEWGECVGIKNLSSEQLRHFAIDHLLSKGLSVPEVQGHLGVRQSGNIGRHAARRHRESIN